TAQPSTEPQIGHVPEITGHVRRNAHDAFAALLVPAAAAGDNLRERLGPHWAALWGPGWIPAVPGDHQRWRIVASAGAEGVVLLGQPLADAEAIELRLNELREQLDLVQHFTRTGTFERDPVTMRGTWDARMFDIWGLPAPPSGKPAPAPSMQTMDSMIVEKEWRHHRFAESHAVAGDHSARLRIRRPDGVVRHIHTQWRVDHDAHGHPIRIRGVNTDDTPLYELATRAEALRGELDAALALARIGVWHHEIDGGRVYLDARCSELMGVPLQRDGMALQDARARIHPADRELVIQATERTLRTGLPCDVELRYPQSDGSTHYVLSRRTLQHDADGRPLRYFGVMLDITEHRLAVQRLRDTVEQMALTAKAIGVGAWETDERVSEVHWDAQMFRLRGVDSPARTVTADEIASYLHPDDRAAVMAAQAAHLLAGESWQQDYRVQWPDGTVRWITSHSASAKDAQGRFVRRIGLNWDSTEAHRAAQALREREAALAQSQEKSRWMTRISHELRTPLNAILGFTQLARRASTDANQSRVANWLALAEDAGQHLRSLIDDILELSSASTGDLRLNLRPVRLADAVAEAVRLVQNDAQSQGVTLDRGDLFGAVQADPLRLRQVLLNLLSNAIKYNHRGGSVQLRSREHDGRVDLQVIDSGRGIPTDRLAEAFEAFNRLGAEAGAVPGTGIGLALVKSLVEQMGGEVAVTSEPGRGTVFTVSLPCAPEPPSSGLACPRAAAPLSAGEHEAEAPAAAVLYIEDNPVNALLVRELLADRPAVQLAVAESGAEGLAAAQAAPPALILVDLLLPDMHGLDVLRALRADARTASVPCVALSVNATPGDVDQALAAGFQAYWTKPIDLANFLDQLSAILGRRV
ncbi:MAG: PAS domain-containing protein, partial [Aquabacterium sp.]|nr:PAS domain-containing protein [Aquabacterium sp.]